MTKQITAFYHQACTYLPSVKLPATPSTKEVALVAITLFAIYKIYKKFQSLENRVTQLEKEKTTTQEKIEQLNLKLTTAEQQIKTLSESIENLKSRMIPLEQYVKENDFQSCEENDEDIIPTDNREMEMVTNERSSTDSDSSNKNSKLEISSEPVNSTSVTPLEQFKQKFPGKELTHKGTNFADLFLTKILRMDEKPKCTLNQEGNFSLTFENDKIISFKKLPEPGPDDIQWIRRTVQTIINTIGEPQIKISKSISGKIEKTELGMTITLDPSCISLVPKATYTGHFKSITILSTATDKGHQLLAHGEHNSWALSSYKSGTFLFDRLIEAVELNF